MKSRTVVHGMRLAAFAAAASALSSAALADDAADAAPKSDLAAAVQTTIFRGDPVSNLYDDVQQWKKDEGVPINIGAWNWWHMFRNPVGGSRRFQYGERGLEGTYLYYLLFDPVYDNGAGTKVGAHLDVRARDAKASWRPYFDSNLWLWEAYGFVEACDTTVKAGKVLRNFGMDWDGSFYGNLSSFDG